MRKQVIALLACACITASGFAQRRPLDPPDLIQFNPLEHFSKSFRTTYLELLDIVRACDSENLVKDAELMGTTLDRTTLLDTINRIIANGQAFAKWDAERNHGGANRTSFDANARALRESIREYQYVDGTPIDVIVDKFQRRYVISWRPFTGYEQGWGGDLIQKYVPFVPQMNITIEAGEDSNVGNGTYSYKVTV